MKCLQKREGGPKASVGFNFFLCSSQNFKFTIGLIQSTEVNLRLKVQKKEVQGDHVIWDLQRIQQNI